MGVLKIAARVDIAAKAGIDQHLTKQTGRAAQAVLAGA